MSQTPEEFLEHYGVKGMKWGVRNEGGREGSRRRATTAEIQNARANTNARLSKIYEADQSVRLATTKKGKDAALKVVEKYAKQLNDSDDTRVASMYTKGERISNAIVAGPVGLLANRVNTKRTTEERWNRKK